jgi:F0F1-type ATP synthase delta subunit
MKAEYLDTLARFAADKIVAGVDTKHVAIAIAEELAARGASSKLDKLMKQIDSYLASQGHSVVHVRSKHPLAQDQLVGIASAFGLTNPLYETSIDPKLIGGAIATTGEQRLDLSANKQLKVITNSLKEEK